MKGQVKIRSGVAVGATYGVAVSAFGVGLSAYTTYNSLHTEKIIAGSAKLEHDIWGLKGSVGGSPGVVYSY